MKNIHILPTDKPSSLFFIDKTLFYLPEEKNRTNWKKELIKPQNIYITSDEEIRRDDLCMDTLTKWIFRATRQIKEKHNFYQKIILTTDPKLIADGIQPIPDEFLEWFVKNPSCESVGVMDDKKLSSKSIYDAVEGDLVYSHHGYGGIINSLSKDVRVEIGNYIETAITSETGWETLDINNYRVYDKCYKIIIPKEEPIRKIDTCYNFDMKIGCVQDICRCEQEVYDRAYQPISLSEVDKEEPKQETLEERKWLSIFKEYTKDGESNLFMFFNWLEINYNPPTKK
jgi:hypothetical protein